MFEEKSQYNKNKKNSYECHMVLFIKNLKDFFCGNNFKSTL